MHIWFILILLALHMRLGGSLLVGRSVGWRVGYATRLVLHVSGRRSSSGGVGIPKGYSDKSLRYKLEYGATSGLPDTSKPFTVLGIESSCDDTGVAVVKSDGTVLSNVVISQNDIHEQFGGIVPTLAMEQHKRNIDIAVTEAVKQAGLSSLSDIDAVAVTKGPGLEICLRVGLRRAQEIATTYTKPFVTVHHLEAHCMIARLSGQTLTRQSSSSSPSNNPMSTSSVLPKIEFPFLAVLASGGHTSILLCKELGEYTMLGGTLDDALGEAFDKAARLLGLRGASSGGVAIERAAAAYKAALSADPAYVPPPPKQAVLDRSGMKVPMRDKPNCDFSYAGLKTAFRLAVQQAREAAGYNESSQAASNAPVREMTTVDTPVTLPEAVTGKLCADFQDVAFDHLEDRLRRALDYVDYRQVPVTSLVVVGGVAANGELRRRLSSLLDARAQRVKAGESSVSTQSKAPLMDLSLVFPPPALCTDNGLMVAWAGVEKLQRGISDAVQGQEPVPRWPIGAPLSAEDKEVMAKLKKLMGPPKAPWVPPSKGLV